MTTKLNPTNLLYDDGTSQTTADIGYPPWTAPTRAINTLYTNSTGRPLLLWVTVGCNVQEVGLWLEIDGVSILDFAQGSNATQQNYLGIFAIVPNGSYYKFRSHWGYPVIYYWNEQ